MRSSFGAPSFPNPQHLFDDTDRAGLTRAAGQMRATFRLLLSFSYAISFVALCVSRSDFFAASTLPEDEEEEHFLA